MSDIIRGHTFVNGEVVEAQSLNDLVSNAVVQPTLISEKVLKDPAALSDRILIEDGGTLKGITLQQIIDLVTPTIVNSAVPVGTVCDYAGYTEPVNWMFCYGQLLDRDVYADLFNAITTGYGAGDGTTTFALPDYRGYVLAGRNDMGGTSNGLLTVSIGGNALGSAGGEERHTTTVNEMPVHAHAASTSTLLPIRTTTQEGGSNYGLVVAGPFTGRVMIAGSMGDQSGQSATTITAAGGNQPHNNLQPTKIVNKIIKVLNA